MIAKGFEKTRVSYKKTIQELEQKAVKWWPDSLKKEAAAVSAIPLLIASHDDFISILCACNKSPLQVFDLIRQRGFPANLFVKHLAVLADVGGETIQRLNTNFDSLFLFQSGQGKYIDAIFNDTQFRYHFQALPAKGSLGNTKLSIDGVSLAKTMALDPFKEDVIMLLLYGASALNATGTHLEKCEIGNFLGKSAELEAYLRQKYIWASRITNGATSNTQGQLAQKIVCNFLSKQLGPDYKVTRNGAIKVDGYARPIPFDTVIQKNDRFIGAEICFQVTTNSVIERKAGQAQERQAALHRMGYNIAYVIDGAGNFQRRNAVSTICHFSDCTVAYSEPEFEELAAFIEEHLP